MAQRGRNSAIPRCRCVHECSLEMLSPRVVPSLAFSLSAAHAAVQVHNASTYGNFDVNATRAAIAAAAVATPYARGSLQARLLEASADTVAVARAYRVFDIADVRVEDAVRAARVHLLWTWTLIDVR